MRRSLILALLLVSMAGHAGAEAKNIYLTVESVDVEARAITGTERRSGRPLTLQVPEEAVISRLGPPRRTIELVDLVVGDELIIRVEADGDEVVALASIRVTTLGSEESEPNTPTVSSSTPQPPAPAETTLPTTSAYVPIAFTAATIDPETVAWTGRAGLRVLVEVPPTDIGNRLGDQSPASVSLDSEALGVPRIDVRSIEVIRFDPVSGQPMPGDDSLDAPTTDHRAYRWLDDAIPDAFPEVPTPLSRTGNALRVRTAANAGHAYAATGDWGSGRLIFTHTQDANTPSYYAIYLDPLPADEQPGATPRGWMGDGLPRTVAQPSSTFATSHVRIDLDDFDNDGDIDIVAGEQYGQLMWLPNIGSVSKPAFDHLRLVQDLHDQPIDIGVHAAPLVIDWDGDGVKDLLVGTYVNRIAYLRNVGSDADRRYVFQGVLEIDGQPLELPARPVAGRDEAIFDHDYYPVLDSADVDGDGRADLIAGGYVTGRIYVYRNTGTDEQGLPMLAFAGPLEADGEPINVGDWCATACVADLDGDGLPDLLTGRQPMTPQQSKDRRAIRFYRNVGSSGDWQFAEQPFPSDRSLTIGSLGTPRVADLNGDDLVDVVLSSGANIWILINIGSIQEPRFEAPDMPLVLSWGSKSLPGRYFIDYNGDGRPDMVRNYSVYLAQPGGSPFQYADQPIDAMKGQAPIRHDTGIGDDWFWPRLNDFDQDGDLDILFGDWHGHVWFHEYRDDSFDPTGIRLKHISGQPIRVGPKQDAQNSFNKLQGARTVFDVGDFNSDSLLDLVLGDTFGDVYVAYSRGSATEPVFDSLIHLGTLDIRCLVDAADYNGDGLPDVIVGAANGRTRIWMNTGESGSARFDEGFEPDLPPIKQPRLLLVDLNDDGDDDLFSPSTIGSVWIERSFLDRGYAPTRKLHIEMRPEPEP